MPMMIAKCTECKFTRHVLLIGGNIIKGDLGESLINHSFKKGHVIKIGDYKYKAIDESHLKRCEENKSVESEIPRKEVS